MIIIWLLWSVGDSYHTIGCCGRPPVVPAFCCCCCWCCTVAQPTSIWGWKRKDGGSLRDPESGWTEPEETHFLNRTHSDTVRTSKSGLNWIVFPHVLSPLTYLTRRIFIFLFFLYIRERTGGGGGGASLDLDPKVWGMLWIIYKQKGDGSCGVDAHTPGVSHIS